MALDATKVLVAVTGAVYHGPTTMTAPTDSTSPVPTGARDVGYISEDGLIESYDESTDTIKAWQNGAIVRTIFSSSSAQYQFTMIETNKNSLELYYKNSTVTGSGSAFALRVRPPGSDIRSFILDVIDGTRHERIYLPRAEVTKRGDVTRVSTDAVSYDVTLTSYPITDPDDATKTLVAYKFSDNPAWGQS